MPSHAPSSASGHATTRGQRAATAAKPSTATLTLTSSPDSAAPSTRRFVSAAPSALPTLTAPAATRPALPDRARAHRRLRPGFRGPHAIAVRQHDLGRPREVALVLRHHRFADAPVLDRDVELVVAHPARDVEIGRADARPERVGNGGLRVQHRPVPLEDAHARVEQWPIPGARDRRQRRDVARTRHEQPHVDTVASGGRERLHVGRGADEVRVAQPELAGARGTRSRDPGDTCRSRWALRRPRAGARRPRARRPLPHLQTSPGATAPRRRPATLRQTRASARRRPGRGFRRPCRATDPSAAPHRPAISR